MQEQLPEHIRVRFEHLLGDKIARKVTKPWGWEYLGWFAELQPADFLDLYQEQQPKEVLSLEYRFEPGPTADVAFELESGLFVSTSDYDVNLWNAIEYLEEYRKNEDPRTDWIGPKVTRRVVDWTTKDVGT